jgi:AraC-like DNA-binding protein
MPSASQIRKNILSALDEYIISALQQQVALGNVSPPFQFPEGINARLISKTVPRPSASSFGYPVQINWPKAKLHSTLHPYLGFIYRGAADEHTIVSAAQASKYHVSKGVYAIRWQSPSVLLFPSGTPRNKGKGSYWDGPEPPSPIRSILWLWNVNTTSEIRVHTSIESAGKPKEDSHVLQIKDQTLTDLFNLFCREMQNAPVNHHHTAQAICLAMMSRLRQHLLVHLPLIANSSYPPTSPLKEVPFTDHSRAAWQDAVSFIQTHLHANLTLPHIARQIELSPAHLSRIFHQFSGVPVMRYVRLQRIAAAQKVLEEGPENITEIARLTGFGGVTVFCRAFRKDTGLTPNQYRRQA